MKPFFNEVRKQFGKLNQKQVECLAALFSEAHGLSKEHTAYIFGTAWHESGRFKYTKEIWGPTKQQLKYEPPHPIAKDLGNTVKGDGKRFMGRGFVQITGRRNYVWASKILGLDVVAMPELAEVAQHAAKIIVKGMVTGAFTGKKLADYFDGDWKQIRIGLKLRVATYQDMRAIVNGTDKAALIAGYARKFQKALEAK